MIRWTQVGYIAYIATYNIACATIFLITEPNLLKLLPYFERVADWDKVCPYLLDDNDGQMTRKIEKNNKDVDGMRKEMLDEFLKKSNATWRNVVSAMRAGRYNSLADEIEKDLKG